MKKLLPATVSKYLLVIISILFLIEIYPIVFTVHDDITTYANVRRGLLWDSAVSSALLGGLPQFLSNLLLGLPMLSGDIWIYKVFSYSTLLFDVVIFYVLVRKIYGKSAAILTAALFWGFATITNQHSLFVSYVLGRQIIIGLILLSVLLFLKYYDTYKSPFLLGSSVFYLLACMIYEGAVPFGLLFLMITIAKTNTESRKFVEKIRPLLLPGFLIVLYVIIYFAWQAQHPVSYEGRQFDFGNPLRSIWSVVMYSLGSFPLYSLVIAPVKNEVGIQDIAFPVVPMVISFITAGLWYYYLPRIPLESAQMREKLAITAVGIFLPNILIGFTPKYMEWNSNGCFTYLTTFYSYFFLLTFAVMIFAIIYQKISCKKVALIITTLAVFLLSCAAVLNNRLWKEEFSHDMIKYRAFDQAVSSPQFLSYSSGTNVYIPDFMGINKTMEQTQNYSKIYTDKDFIFTNKKEDLDFTKKVIALEYSAEDEKIILKELN